MSLVRPVNVPDSLSRRGQAGVPVQRAGGGEPARVAGLGQHRCGPDRGDAVDRGDQPGQAQLVEHGEHPGLDLDQPALIFGPIG